MNGDPRLLGKKVAACRPVPGWTPMGHWRGRSPTGAQQLPVPGHFSQNFPQISAR
jgi:hypothetical protein